MAVTALPDLLLVDQYRKMGCSGPLWMWMHDLVMSWFQALRYLMLHLGVSMHIGIDTYLLRKISQIGHREIQAELAL